MTEQEGKKKVSEVKTFPVLLPLRKNQENLTINTNTPSKSSKEQIINQAFRFHSQGNISEAMKCYEQFINKGFKDHRVYSNLGNILNEHGRPKEAVDSYRKAIEINPDYVIAHYNLGIIFINLGKSEEAEIYTREAIKIDPNIAEAHLNLGTILIGLGRLKEAEVSYRKAIEIKPDCAEAYSCIGNILKDHGKYDEAYKYFQKCLELDPNDLSYNMQAKLFISKIPLNQLQINQEREELNRQITLIGNNKNIIYKNNRLPTSIDFLFYLSYHNCNNDKEIIRNIANNLSKKQGILNTNFNVDQHIKESLRRKSEARTLQEKEGEG